MEQNNTRKYTIIVTTLMIMALSVGLLSTYLTANPEYILLETVQTSSGSGVDDSLGLVLIVEHYRDNKMIERVEKENDIFLRNFGSYIASTLAGVDTTSFYLNDYNTGASRAQLWADSQRIDQTTAYIGEGTTPPALLDWSMETPVQNGIIQQVGYTISGSQMNVTMAISFGITDSYGINEVGFSYMLDIVTLYHYLMARDILPSQIDVISGDILTVKYVMMFN